MEDTTQDMLCVAQAKGSLQFSQPLPFKELFRKIQETLQVDKVFAMLPDGRGGYSLREVGRLDLTFVLPSEVAEPPSPRPPSYQQEAAAEEEPPTPRPVKQRKPRTVKPRPSVLPPPEPEPQTDFDRQLAKTNPSNQPRSTPSAPAVEHKSRPGKAARGVAGGISVDGFIPASPEASKAHDFTTGWK